MRILPEDPICPSTPVDDPVVGIKNVYPNALAIPTQTEHQLRMLSQNHGLPMWAIVRALVADAYKREVELGSFIQVLGPPLPYRKRPGRPSTKKDT